MNQRCEVCEGLVHDGKTGVSKALHAVLEPYAGKARTYGSSGAAFPRGNAATHYMPHLKVRGLSLRWATPAAQSRIEGAGHEQGNMTLYERLPFARLLGDRAG